MVFLLLILSKAIKREGIFRTNGYLKKRNILIKKVNSNEKINFDEFLDDVETIASLVSKYFASIEDDLFPKEFVEEYFEIRNSEDEEKKPKIIEILKKLPEKNYNLIKLMFGLLYKVYENRELNLMGSKNLIFCLKIKVYQSVNCDVSFLKADLIENYNDYF
jgi:hypothetical protein